MRNIALLTAAIVTEVAGTLSLKATDGFTKPLWIVPVVLGYIAAFYFLSQALAGGMPVGVAYGIWAALGVILTAIGGAVMFGDPLSGLMALGMALIIAGVICVEMGSRRAGGTREAA